MSLAARAQEATIEAVTGRVRDLEAAEDIDPAVKRKLLDLYGRALEELRTADGWAVKEAALRATASDAPVQIAGIRVELAEPSPAPEALDGAALDELEARMLRAELELARARKTQAELESERRQMVERRSEAPELVSAARRRSEEAERDLEALPVAGETPETTAARRVLLLATKAAADGELAALELEASTREMRNALLRAKLDLAARRASEARREIETVRTLVHRLRRSQADEAAQEARKTLKELSSASAAMRRLAESNVVLAEERTGADGLLAKAGRTSVEAESARATLGSVRIASGRAREKVRVLGFTQTAGLVLRREKAALPKLKACGRRLRARRTEIARVQLRLVELEDERSALADIDRRARQFLSAEGVPAVDAARETVLKLLRARRDAVDTLLGEYGGYFDGLVELDSVERELVGEAEAFAAFVEERVLWVRGARPLGPSALGQSWQAAVWFARPERWLDAGRSIASRAASNGTIIGMAVILFAGLTVTRRRLRIRLVALGERAAAAEEETLGRSLKALVLTVLVALPPPLLLWVVGWRLGSSAGETVFPGALGAGLRTAGVGLLTVAFIREMCGEKGLAETHFHWPAEGLAFARKSLIWLVIVGVPLAFLVATTEWQENEAHKGSLGRLAFLAGMVLAAILAHRLLRPGSPLWETRTSLAESGWFYRLRHAWHVAGLACPVLLAGLAAFGYYYTALQLAWRVLAQLWLLAGVFTVEALLFRWTLIARRNLAIRRARKRKALKSTEGPSSGTQDQGDALPETAESEVDLRRIGVQSRRFVWYVMGLGLLLGTWWIWADVLPALGILRSIELWTVTVKGAAGTGVVAVTLADLLLAAVIVAVTALAAANVPGLLEVAILQRLPFDQGARFAITSIARYAIGVVGVVIALGLVGVTWTSVQWLVAAMTVGLGFGLQEIFANFVSGLIILFERPVRIGDVVTVGGVTGTVSRIRIRATTITDWDRKELVVPNKEFITGHLVNWSLSDKILRVVVPVGIAYGSDTELARETLLRVARENTHVLEDPGPAALFMNFGESSLEFELRVYIPNISHYVPAISSLHMEIDGAFRKAGIEIAFPQRDVHVRSVGQAIPFVERTEEGSGAHTGREE